MKNIKRGNLLAGSHPLRSLHRQSEQDVRVKHRTKPATNLPKLTNHSPKIKMMSHNFIKPPLSVPEPRTDSNLGLHRCCPSPRSLLHLCHQVSNFVNTVYFLSFFVEFSQVSSECTSNKHIIKCQNFSQCFSSIFLLIRMI